MHSIDLNRVPAFYHGYIQKVQTPNLATAFEEHLQTSAYLKGVPADRWDHSYAEGKWTIKELVQHMIDAERIFAYRALRFARRDATPLPGFDENAYAVTAHAHVRQPADLLHEFEIVQQGSALLFASFNAQDLAATGTSNGHPIYVEAIGYIIVGHALHHLQVMQERYLKGLVTY